MAQFEFLGERCGGSLRALRLKALALAGKSSHVDRSSAAGTFVPRILHLLLLDFAQAMSMIRGNCLAGFAKKLNFGWLSASKWRHAFTFRLEFEMLGRLI